MELRWVTLQDVHAFPWHLAAMLGVGLCVLAVSINGLRNRGSRRPEERVDPVQQALRWIVPVFVLIWSALVGNALVRDAIILPAQLDSDRHELSEGPITRLVMLPWKGYGQAIFTVGGHRFDRFDTDATSKDGKIVRPGCMAEGQPARIAHIGSTILRIEVAADQNHALPKCRGEQQ